MIIKRIVNFFLRLRVLALENGRIFHFGDGKDFILIKELELKEISPNIFSLKEPREYGEYLKQIGFKNIRVVAESVFRYKCETSAINMMWTSKLYDK